MTFFYKVLSLLTHSERKSALTLLVLMLFGMTLETLGVGLVVPVIGLMMQEDLASKYALVNQVLNFFNNPSQSEIIIGAILFLVLAFLVKNMFLAFLAWCQARFAYGVQRHISQRLFNTYLAQDYDFHLKRNSAQLIRNVTTETNLFTLSINAFLLIVAESFVALGIIALLLFVEPVGAMLVAMVLALAMLGFLWVTKSKILSWGKARQYHEGMRIQHLQQAIGGIKDVILLNREGYFQKEYQKHNVKSSKVASLQFFLQQMPRLWLEFLAILGLAILVIIMVNQGGGIQTILPILGLFAAAAFRLIPSVNRILSSIQTVRYGIPIVDLLYNEFNLKHKGMSEARSPFELSNSIELKKISFLYQDTSANAISNISIKISRGESIGLIGESGSGKSTLVDIILGLLQPRSGLILVDGANIHDNIKGWQRQIGYVPQTIYLTDNSLRENIAFGIIKQKIDPQAIERALEAAHLTAFIASLPDGLDTIVGERGVRLSGGQRQRIGIARALYNDPDVLVLDEATSALDNDTEHEIMKAIAVMHGSKTIIIVAHRLSTVENCDQIYRLQSGRIVGQGSSFDMLMSQKEESSS